MPPWPADPHYGKFENDRSLSQKDIDTMLASYLLDATRSGHLIEDLALEHTSYKALSIEDVCGRGAKAISLADVPVEAAVVYACERADLPLQLVVAGE